MPIEYILILLISLLAFRKLVIIFHELGHAFASLLHSDGKVSVYIGSYGNPEQSFQFQIQRLEFFIKYNVFSWKGGLCIPHGANVTWKSRIWISLSGPLATLIIGSVASLFVFFFGQLDILNLILFAFAFSCILDFLYNSIPRKTQIQLYDGTFANTDGKQLLHLWSIRNIYENYTKALQYYDAKDYINAAELFKKCIAITPENPELYRLAISAYLIAKEDAKAVQLQQTYSEKFPSIFDEFDYINSGMIAIHEKNYTKALEAFEEALFLKPTMMETLNNYGFILGILERHEEAIIQLDKAIEIGDNAYCYCNRGYSKLKLGQFKDGLADTQKALELDPEDAYVYRNFGLYHFHKKDYSKALKFYKKALALDPETHKIQQYIKEVQAKLKT